MHNKKYLLPFLILFSFHISQVQAQPVITNVVYDVSDSALVVTGTGFEEAAGATNDVDVSLLTFTGEGGSTYTLTDSPDVEITSDTQFSVSLSVTDSDAIHLILNKNGVASTGGTAYNLAAADNYITNVVGSGSLTNAISVGNVLVPTISGATYDFTEGKLVVSGTNFLVSAGANNDIDVSLLTLRGGVVNGGIETSTDYTLTDSADVEVINRTTFEVILSATDFAAVNLIFHSNGTDSSNGVTHSVLAAEDWATGADAAVNVVDNSSNTVTVINVIPTIYHATYDTVTANLVVTGTGFVANAGANNDVDASLLIFVGEGGSTYTLTDTTDAELTDENAFTVTLSTTDKAAVNLILNKNGTTSTVGTTYNLAAADDFIAAVTAGSTADSTNAITVSNVLVPELSSATYDASSGTLLVTGLNFLVADGSNNDVDVSLLTFKGEGASTYTLTDSADVDVSKRTLFTVTLSSTDKAAVNLILNTNGTTATSGDAYNLGAAEDWAKGADATVNVLDNSSNAIVVSNVVLPIITSANYDAGSGTLLVSGSHFVSASGSSNDIDASLLTLTGEGGSTYTLTNTGDVDVGNPTTFTVVLSATDKAAVNLILNKAGTSSTVGTSYNLAAAEDWALGTLNNETIADTSGNGVTVSNVGTPTVISATYDYIANQLTLTGTNFHSASGANNDVDVSAISITGDGSATHTLGSSSDVEIINGTTVTILLTGTDLIAIEALLNSNGSASANADIYNLAVADDWNPGTDPAVSSGDFTNVISVTNFTNPTIIRADYDATSGVLLVTGNNFVANAGASNDIDTSLLTILGANNDTYALTNSADVELTSDNAFSVTLSATDLIHINGILNKNGTDSGSAISYNLSVADNWMAGSPAANSIEDTVSNPVTVINTPTPTISSAIYDVDTGSLVVTGTHLAHLPGANNDIDVSLFTFKGEAGDTYRLTDSPDVDVSTTTSFSLTLSATDRTEVNKILNKNGTIAADAVAYNLAAAQGWEKAADVSITLADLTGNSITVINVDTQTQEPDPPLPPLVVADSFVLLLEKQSVSIAFFGGKGPFTVISDTPSVASVVLNGTSVTITPGVEGSSSVFVEDSVGQIAIIKVVVQDGVFEPEPVPEKEMELIIGGGVTSDDGDTFSESGEVSVGDKIQIIATVVPYANHVGEGAGILVALIEAGNPDTIVLLKADGGFIEFNNRSLEFFTEIILAQYNEVDITRGESMTITADTVGSYAIYIAYQLFSNGVIYYAGDPIRIDVIE